MGCSVESEWTTVIIRGNYVLGLCFLSSDCSELFDRRRLESGFYRIRPDRTLEPFLVYCDMEDGGGWTVVQKRRNGKVDFNR